MSLIYVLIASGQKVLCDYSAYHGTFEQISQSLLSKVQPNTTASFQYKDQYIFYYLNSNGVTYLCMADMNYPNSAASSFLDSIKTEFNQTYPNKDFNTVGNLGLNEFFKQKLSIKLDYYNQNKNASLDQTGQLKKGIVDFKNQVLDANDILNQRGEKINLIVQKAEMLSQESNSFYSSAKGVRRREQCKRIKQIALLTVCILAIIYVILGIACGWTFGCLRKP